MTTTELLKLNLDIIDAFVIAYDVPIVTNLWYSICEKGWFKENNGFLRSAEEAYLEMFDAYTKFIEQLPIQNKLDYINFYESQLIGKAWKQLYMDGATVKNFGFELVEANGTKWYEDTIKELNMK